MGNGYNSDMNGKIFYLRYCSLLGLFLVENMKIYLKHISYFNYISKIAMLANLDYWYQKHFLTTVQ